MLVNRLLTSACYPLGRLSELRADMLDDRIKAITA